MRQQTVKLNGAKNWPVSSDALAIYEKSKTVIEHDRMNQEFPYVIAAIMVPSNWCHRASPYCTTRSFVPDITRTYAEFFFFPLSILYARTLTHVAGGGVERLKWHKLERYLRQMRGWQYGLTRRSHTSDDSSYVNRERSSSKEFRSPRYYVTMNFGNATVNCIKRICDIKITPNTEGVSGMTINFPKSRRALGLRQ